LQTRCLQAFAAPLRCPSNAPEDPAVLSPKTLRSLRLAGIALGAGYALWLAPATARAAVAVAADLEVDAASDSDLGTAPAIAVRLGWQLHLPLIVFTPEMGYHHVAFGEELTLDRAFAGARLGIGEVFRIGAFGHVGVAHAAFRSAAEGQDVTDVTIDVGGFLDFTLLPVLDVGLHAGYGRVRTDDGDTLEWVPVGIHLALIF
jgi:hypothetical protein